MGSFNTTCAISHAPIREGDKVRLLFLASNSYVSQRESLEENSISNGSQCYPCDDFSVIGGVAIPAEYADYNTYEFDEDSLQAELILKTIKDNYLENVPVKGVRYNSYHDHMSVSADSLDWSKVQDMIHSGRLFLRGITSKKVFVAFMAVHENVYQVLKQNSWKRYDYDLSKYVECTVENEISKALNKYSESVQKSIFDAEYAKQYNAYKEIIEACTDEEAKEKLLQLVKARVEMSIMMVDDNNSNRGGSRDFFYSSKDVIGEAYTLKNDNDLSEETFVEFVRLAKETEAFNLGMVIFNYMYRPVMTSGQEHNFPAHAQMLRELADAIESTPSSWSDESFSTSFHKEYWQEINISDIEKQVNEWFGEYISDFAENLEAIRTAIKDLPYIVVEPSDFKLYGIDDFVENHSVQLRIYNK